MMAYDYFIVALGNFMGGPDEEFPEDLDYSAMIIGFVLVILVAI